MRYAQASGGAGQALFGRAARSRVRLDGRLRSRAGLGSTIWQEDQIEGWEEDGVCPEGQEEPLTSELYVGVSECKSGASLNIFCGPLMLVNLYRHC